MKRLIAVGVALAAMLPMTAGAARIGVFVGPGFFPYAPYPLSSSMFPYTRPAGIPNAGTIKVQTSVKDARVFIDGAYAGTAGNLKSMPMQAGTYTIEVQSPGRAPFRQQVFVVAGKTIRIHAELTPEPKEVPQG